jgi:C4-dicarboxylate-binding protein DctP
VQVDEITPEEQAALRKALMPVHKEMESRIGKQWIDAVYKEAAAVGVRY